MNRDELTPIELECNMGKDANGVEHREPWKAYDIDEVDALLAKKDKEITQLQAMLEERNKQVGELTEKLDSMTQQFSKYVVDAGNRVLRLKRALYKACANWAKLKQWDISTLAEDWDKWDRMFDKCQVMAERYKEVK